MFFGWYENFRSAAVDNKIPHAKLFRSIIISIETWDFQTRLHAFHFTCHFIFPFLGQYFRLDKLSNRSNATWYGESAVWSSHWRKVGQSACPLIALFKVIINLTPVRRKHKAFNFRNSTEQPSSDDSCTNNRSCLSFDALLFNEVLWNDDLSFMNIHGSSSYELSKRKKTIDKCQEQWVEDKVFFTYVLEENLSGLS